MLVYFANRTHNKIEKEYFSHLIERMENNSFTVFQPGDDEQENRRKIKEAQIYALILDGRTLEKNLLFELGMFYGLKNFAKPANLIAALRLSESVPEKILPESALSAIDCLARSEYDFIDCLKSYLVTISRQGDQNL